MGKHVAGLSLVAAVVVAAGCASAPRAPVTADGKKTAILILSDRGNPAEMNERQFQFRNEVGQWMEKDLVNQLTRAGYDAKLIKAKDEFAAGAGRYLLTVKITGYNPGSSAARMLVGFGAGSASLDNHYELCGADGKAVAAWDDGCGTSEHWSKMPRRLNANTVRRVTKELTAAKAP